jgi:hypothetical protein
MKSEIAILIIAPCFVLLGDHEWIEGRLRLLRLLRVFGTTSRKSIFMPVGDRCFITPQLRPPSPPHVGTSLSHYIKLVGIATLRHLTL